MSENRVFKLNELLVTVLVAGLFSSCAHLRPPPPAKEARGVWLSRFEYCQASSTHDQDSIRAYISDVINRAAEARFNLIFFQVRGAGDAYYTPGLEPWGGLLTGTPGEDPGWDPLEYALELAHRRGLELHAWFNTFPVWRGRQPPPETVPRAPYRAHPEWMVCDSASVPMPLSDHYVSFSPGIPEVHEYIIDVVLDVATRYDIDGVHFDYIRYPENSPAAGFSHDSISVRRFNSSAGNPWQLDWEDWQREQLTQFVARACNALTAAKPWLKLSAAVLGTYNYGGWGTYHAVYQDPRRWTELGKLDFIVPMLYWPRKHTTQPFLERAIEWRDHFTLDRYVFPGIGSYRYNTRRRPYHWTEAEGQIDGLRKRRIPGMIFFASRSLETRWADLAATRFRTPANIPAMPWKDDDVPGPPSGLKARITPSVAGPVTGDPTVILTWVTPEDDDVQRFNIYLSEKLPINKHDGRNLWAVTTGPRLEWTLNFQGRSKGNYVAVSALDAAWNESGLSEAIKLE